MPLKNFVCWQPDRIGEVVRIDAEAARDPEFLAIHTKSPIANGPTLDTSGGSDAALDDPDVFLKRFLDPIRRNHRIAIVGESGSGKSHLIRWMRLNMPVESNRKVFSIQRAQVSLHSVLKELIALLPDKQRADYEEVLNRGGGETISPDQRRDKLTAALADSIRETPPQNPDDDFEKWLHTGLADMFHDPFVRSKMTEDGSFIHRLADHIFERNSEYERRSRSYQFEVTDIPSLGTEIIKCSAPVREFLSVLISASSHPRQAAKVVNQVLDKAIQRSLEFSGDRLIELLTDVRRSLGKEDIQLVLLIEDLARLQGIDMALLQALSAETKDPELCDMRWAVAVTRGYYSRLPASFITRVVETVDMDKSSINRRSPNNEDLISFSANYLRAVRTDSQELKTWSVDTQRGDPPNKCDDCNFRAECHKIFGEVNNIGLYPFTAHALTNMSNRANVSNGQEFTPRDLLGQVILPVLHDFQRISSGQFPHSDIVKSLGGPKLSVAVREELSRTAGSESDMATSLIELYSPDTDVPIDVERHIWDTFGIGYQQIGVSEPKNNDDQPKPDAESKTESDPIVLGIERWAAGQPMQSTTAKPLRGLVFDWISQSIDWDGLGLARTTFVSGSGAFRRERINFKNMTARGRTAGPGSVVLELPLTDKNEDLLSTALALQGLHMFYREKTWAFKGADKLYPRVMEELTRWRDEVLRSIRDITVSDSDWDPVASAIELLTVGAALSGKISSANTPTHEVLDSALGIWPEPDHNHTKEWNDLYGQINKRKAELTKVITSLSGAGKGGTVSTLNPMRLFGNIRSVVNGWNLKATPDNEIENFNPDIKQIATLWRSVNEKLPSVIAQEFERRNEWLVSTEISFGVDWKKTDVALAMDQVREKILSGGIAVNQTIVRRFSDALQGFKDANIDAALRSFRSIVDTDDKQSQLSQLGLTRGLNAIQATDIFRDAAERFVDESEAMVKVQGGNDQVRVSSVSANIETVKKSLAELRSSLTQIGNK